MNSDIFLNKLNNYLDNRTGFLSAENLNECYNKFLNKKFKLGYRFISSNGSTSASRLFNDEELKTAMLFVEQGTIFDNLEAQDSIILNRFTFTNFKKKSVVFFTKTGTFLRGTRYV